MKIHYMTRPHLTENLIKTLMVAVLLLQSSVFSFQSSTLHAQTGTWHSYMSYYEPQQIVKSGNQLFVRASNSLYSYNLDDQSITTFDNVRQLNDTYITLIGLNKDTKKLLLVYQNQNMDIVDCQSYEVENISALYLKAMTVDKTVNSIYMQDRFAYLATGFGILKINMQKAEISESYILNKNITNVAISDNYIYAKTTENNAVIMALLTSNLLDPNNWQTTATAPTGIFNQDLSEWTQYHDLVSSLNPGGPKYNIFGFMTFRNGKLYTCGGDINAPKTAIQILQNGEWNVYNEDIKEKTGLSNYGRLYSLTVDPKDENHIFAGATTGLYEYKNGNLISFYNQENSPMESALNPNKYSVAEQKNYDLITSVIYDKKGNVWSLNSQAPAKSLLQLNTDNNEWTAHSVPSIMIFNDDGLNNKSLPWMKNLMTDSRNFTWFVNSFWQNPSIHLFYLDDNNGTLHSKSFYNFVNQNGETIAVDFADGVQCITEDRNNDIWVGTVRGPLLLKHEEIYSDNPVFTQVVIPRNDGSDYADYLLDGIDVTCIMIDGANRKWIGTSANGLYVISNDNMVQEYHFVTTNSSLLSNSIISLAYNEQSGEVFIGTEKGLCSFMSDAVGPNAVMEKDNVYAYPNPVVKDYNGLINIVGLAFDSDVKILSTSGKLIAQGRSKGGMFTWNGCDREGRRVASGVYLVAAATADGKKGTVCKIAVIN